MLALTSAGDIPNLAFYLQWALTTHAHLPKDFSKKSPTRSPDRMHYKALPRCLRLPSHLF